MSSDPCQEAKRVLAEAQALTGDLRATFLADIQSASPQVYETLVRLMADEEETLRESFSADSEETQDRFVTGIYDPETTSEFVHIEDLKDPQTAQSPPRDLVGKEYELEKKIGQGGMGVVYRAYHRSLRRTVALKIITGGGLRDEIDIARFHIEAEAAARLDHPGIIPVYDVGQHKGNHYYAMAYIPNSRMGHNYDWAPWPRSPTATIASSTSNFRPN